MIVDAISLRVALLIIPLAELTVVVLSRVLSLRPEHAVTVLQKGSGS